MIHPTSQIAARSLNKLADTFFPSAVFERQGVWPSVPWSRKLKVT